MRFLVWTVALALTLAAAIARPQQQLTAAQRKYQQDYARYQQQLAAQQAAQQQQPGFNSQTAPASSRSEVRDDSNQYAIDYKTVDGQQFTESGRLVPVADGSDYVLYKTGSYSYYPPGSQTPVQVTYTADDTGFHPQGNVLPQGPVDAAPQPTR